MEFGKDTLKQVIKNAKKIAESLANYGFRVLGEKRGYTQSHQIAVDVSKYKDGGTIERIWKNLILFLIDNYFQEIFRQGGIICIPAVSE